MATQIEIQVFWAKSNINNTKFKVVNSKMENILCI